MLIPDIGKFVGRYLQALGWFTIASMLVSAFLGNGISIDLSFIFYFWAGSSLIEHHAKARKWTIGYAAFIVIFVVGWDIYCLFAGTHGMHIKIGHDIADPSMRQIVEVSAFLCTVAAIPLVLLLTPQAKREFAPMLKFQQLGDWRNSTADTQPSNG